MFETVWSILGMGIYLVLLPFLYGSLLCKNSRRGEWISRYVYGMLGMMAVFQIACVPLVLTHRALHEAVILWHILLVLSGIFLWKGKKKPQGVKRIRRKKWTVEEGVLLAAVLALLAVQCAAYVFGTHIDDDDARYVANAVAAYETDTMYYYHPNTGEPMDYFMGEIGKETTSPMMMFYAAVSFLVRVHPTILIHTVWAVVWLLVSYGVYWMISGCFYPENRRNRLVFLIFAMVLQIFGNTSIYTSQTFLLTRLWQGKALVPAVFAPFFLHLFLRRFGGTKEAWYRDLVLANLAACLCSGMGVYLSAVLAVVIVLVTAVREKSLGTFIKGCFCCVPNAVYTGLYILVHLVLIR
ncbi:MAG: DUF6077 domain-containing protein [Eubacteriales bacterium]|nr:DUF6077 domain-containing protein [Eubacteriales bacterium]